MIVYRIVKTKHAKSLIPPFMNNRWNSNNYQLLYTSWARSLACLENIVHKSGEMLSKGYTCMLIEIPDSLVISEVKLSDMPVNWKNSENAFTKIVGDSWAASAETCVLKVPSSIIKEESNYILNPLHKDFKKIKIIQTQPFTFDERIKQ